MKSIGAPKIQLYLGTDDEFEDKDYLNLALDLSLIEKDKLKKVLTNEEAIEIIEKLDSLYYGEFWPRDLEQVDYQGNVKVISSEDVVEYNRDENTLITSESLQVGDIITLLDKYIRTGLCEDVIIKEKIDGMYAANRFKLEPIPFFKYAGKE